MDQAWLEAQHAEIAAVQAEIAGMQAENLCRENSGHQVTYNEAAFQAKAEELRSVAYSIMINR